MSCFQQTIYKLYIQPLLAQIEVTRHRSMQRIRNLMGLVSIQIGDLLSITSKSTQAVITGLH